ncbi:MAG: SO2930 family diheme c-type cytochrome [Povalibacter sp.]
MLKKLLLACVLVTLSSCQRPSRTDAHLTLASLPARLSDWHVVEIHDSTFTLNSDFVPYDLNSALFSDYAHKLRAIRVPAGTSIRYGASEFEFPVGTVIAKTFYYPRAAGADRSVVNKVLVQEEGDSLDLRVVRLLETRLLINTESGWIAAPYVWNEEQTQATLELAGDSVALELDDGTVRQAFDYVIPDANQCAGCHAADHHRQILKPIGVKAPQLNKEYRYTTSVENQLKHWSREKLMSGVPRADSIPRNARWDAPGSLDARARAYLDVNCAHCHSAQAAANTSGLLLDSHQQEPSRWGVCKIPVASGRGSGTGAFDIVPGAPDQSILLYRMTSTEPDVAMPELGRSLVHVEGVALIREWIASMKGECAPDRTASN